MESEIRQRLVDVHRDLESYDVGISRLKAMVISLENQRAELEIHAEEYDSLLAPIRKLPPEILRTIFSHFCTANVVEDTISSPAVILGAVCAHWRTLSLSFPELWSNIELCTYEEDGYDEDRASLALGLILSRSASHPLTITIHDENETIDAGSPVSLLINQSSRWRKASLFITDISGPTLASLSGNLPLLERLVLNLHSTPEEPLRCFSIAPRLRSVHVSRTRNVILPTSQLEKLELSEHKVHLRNLGRTLEQASQLATLTFERCSLKRDNAPQGWFSSATSLSVTSCRSFQLASEIFTYATMHSLSNIRLELESRTPEEFPLPEFSTFLTRSACTIITLCLTDIFGTAAPLNELLALLPNLASFEYIQSKTTAQFGEEDGPLARMVARPRPTGVLLLKLKRLSLSLHALFPQRALVNMVKSRWLPYATDDSMTVCLKEVKIKLTSDQFDRVTIDPLRDISRSGMRVELRDKDGLLSW